MRTFTFCFQFKKQVKKKQWNRRNGKKKRKKNGMEK